MRRRLLQHVLRESGPGRRQPSWWDLSELTLVAVGFLAYFLVRGAVVDRTTDAMANARDIVQLQASIGIWIEPQLQQLALGRGKSAGARARRRQRVHGGAGAGRLG